MQRGREYKFHQDNPFLVSDNPYQEGVALYGAGKLNEAVLAFEAALKADMTDSNCWRLLGTCYSENDDDVTAIGPLLKSIECDPTNLEALLELGVSFTNELEESEALKFLHSWLLHHPDFKHVPGDQPVDLQTITAMFVRASEFAPKDCDVWAVLGVVYNLSREFDKAVVAFRNACELDPTNYSLFNKLGATQANSSDPDGPKNAILAYRKALELKPNYVRSWSNMGISYANQGLYQSAAKYYLKALSLNDQADHIWGYLRFTLSCLNRPDLVRKADLRNVDAFTEDFKFK
jgi:peroxin-5